MEKRVLAVRDNTEKVYFIEKKDISYDIFVYMAADFAEALLELQKNNNFLLIVLFLNNKDILEEIRILRSLTEIPILVIRQQYDGIEKIAAIEAGADEYIKRPDTIEEGAASAQALIRRYTDFNRREHESAHILSRCGVFISPEHRRVFINAREIQFPRREFDLFYLLARNPGRVFTHEQLYREIWGDEYIYISDNSLNSCLRRIRKRLSMIPDVSCRIENKWGVGYRFIQ